MQEFILSERLRKGQTFIEYMDLIEKKSMDTDNDQSNLIKLNYRRMKRIQNKYTVDDNLCEKIRSINTPQIWMVLTEDWCGDSAQNIPYLAKIAECNPLIDFRILIRDQNLDIMDLYLTNGKSRSIPKLVAFDSEGNELFQWGPRPKDGQDLVDKAKEEGKSKEEFLNELHLWYAKNHGNSLESEINEIIEELETIPRN